MIKQWLNYKTMLALVAVCIVVGTIFYSRHLSKKIANDEKQKVIAWIEAQQTIAKASDSSSLNLASIISTGNTDIPIIETDENDNINPNGTKNLDSGLIHKDTNYLKQQLAIFKKQNEPILVVISEKPYMANKYYYGESELQKEVRYYPIVQLVVVALFIIILFIAQRTSYRSTQTQLWAGMAKETAHQLGTPVSSLQGWLEMMREIQGNEKIVPEMEKDVQRLQLISDRFGKIGSQPQLEERNMVQQISYMMDYIKKRAGGKVHFILDSQGQDEIIGMVSPPLFDWVMENLLKNALDAMDGKGSITVSIKDNTAQISIEVTDTGKGINKANINKVFKPGFSTKKRGWGLGLTLTKRIVEQYHKGQIFVTQSELGKGTTFKIILPK
jgi:signal transduction histidine kinase